MAQLPPNALDHIVAQLRHEFDSKLNYVAGGIRKETSEVAKRTDQSVRALSDIAKRVTVSRGGSSRVAVPGEGNTAGQRVTAEGVSVVRIEDIPGRRVPFVMLVEIPIGANDTSSIEASVTISQDGPFVAVKRMATFLSQYSYSYTDPDTDVQTVFNGRSHGRYRPIHSAGDITDNQHNSRTEATAWFSNVADLANAGGSVPVAALSLPSSAASFRTMEFDGRIEIIQLGSGYPRQNISVPSAMWSPNITAPADLAALDFFERGEVITIRVQPTHPNNPNYGNVAGSGIWANISNTDPTFPFVAGQFDPHEGIMTPAGVVIGTAQGADPTIYTPVQTDPIARLADGILIIGFEGYRIIQPPTVAY